MNYSRILSFISQTLCLLENRPNSSLQGLAPPWDKVVERASAHQVLPLLYPALARGGLLAGLPDELSRFLQQVHELNQQRNQILKQALLNTTGILNQAGIQPLLLKGAIALLPGQYPGAFYRIISDLDLLIEPDRIDTAARVLQRAGYSLSAQASYGSGRRRHHHLPPLLHPQLPVSIELHHRLLPNRVAHQPEVAQLFAQAKTLELEGVRLRAPSLAHRLAHNFLHNRIGDQGFEYHRQDLRQLWEFAQLAKQANGDIVQRLRSQARNSGYLPALDAWLLGAQRHFGVRLDFRPGWSARHADRLVKLFERYPRWQRVTTYPKRLKLLPRRLSTPGWYSEKWRALTRDKSR